MGNLEIAVQANPFLGPNWVPLAKAIKYVLQKTYDEGQNFHLQTYAKAYGASPDSSPYLQARIADNFLEMEISGNLVVDPPLTEYQIKQLGFYGWLAPEVTPEEYSDGGSGNPNFVRYYNIESPLHDIVEFILVTLVGIFGMTEDDFWGFENGTDADEVDEMNLLGRLKGSAGNPNRVIFALPGHHFELIDKQ